MESIDKLRKWCDFLCGSQCDGCSKTLHLIADEIEAEIAERYMLLPVDADGVPWTLDTESFIDDTGCNVCFSGLQVDYKGRWKILSNCVWHDPSLCSHVKPCTLEDVLVDMLEAAVGYSDAHTDVSLVAVEKYADEIRELLDKVGD